VSRNVVVEDVGEYTCELNCGGVGIGEADDVGEPYIIPASSMICDGNKDSTSASNSVGVNAGVVSSSHFVCASCPRKIFMCFRVKSE